MVGALSVLFILFFWTGFNKYLVSISRFQTPWRDMNKVVMTSPQYC